MPIRIDMGTDVAMVGLWDPAHTPTGLRDAPFNELGDKLQAEAKSGRLFFINTGGDGSFLTNIYIDEQPDPELLSAYVPVDRAFLIACESGRLIAGGLEDFGSDSPQITSEDDAFDVASGRYALRFYELDSEEMAKQLKAHVSAEDLAYYVSRFTGCKSGCLLFIAALVLSAVSWVLMDTMPWLWLAVAGCLVWWVVSTVIRRRQRAADERFQDIARRVAEFDERFTSFIFVLEPVPDDAEIEGGWHDLF